MLRRGVGRRRNGPRDEGRRSKKQRDKTLDLITGWCGMKLPSPPSPPQGKAYQTYSPLPPSLTPSPYQTPTDTACPLLAMELFRIHPAFLSSFHTCHFNLYWGRILRRKRNGTHWEAATAGALPVCPYAAPVVSLRGREKQKGPSRCVSLESYRKGGRIERGRIRATEDKRGERDGGG
jgi:hypothetical protein